MSDATAIQKATPEVDDHLDHDEVIAALNALSADEKLKLHAIEGVQLRGTGFAPKDLLHDAICRTLLGDRRCPKHVPFMAFLAMTMKSIASHERERRWRSLQVVPRHGEASVAPSDCPAEQLSPEEHLVEREADDTVQKILDHFKDDEEAQLLIMGWADKGRGRELREATGLDQAALDYAGKRIRVRMRKLYPNGWMP